jgi:hypothetical protein
MSAAHERHPARALACTFESRYMRRNKSASRKSGNAWITTRTKVASMATIPVLIQLVEAIRRALQKTGRGLSLLVEAFIEAQEDCRRMARKHPFTE